MEAKKEEKKTMEVLDLLNATGDPEYQKQFLKGAKEVVLISCKASKFNKYNWLQERNIIITQENIYNFNKKKLKRVINIEKLAGLTKSVNVTSKEFVIHVNKEHDYRLKSDQREMILSILKKYYASLKMENLPIYGIKNKELREFTTTERDLEKGLSRVPLILARMHEEDIIKKEDGKDSTQTSQLNLETLESLDNYVTQRNKALSIRLLPKKEQQDEEEQNDEICSPLFQRSSSQLKVTLDQFKILNIVGKGTFGKVYLVQHEKSKKFYAMKSIRKDIVIEHDTIENLHLEKLILLQVNHPFIISMEFVFIKSYRIYFIMDFVQGGELFKHLSESRRFSEERTKFYAAQIALALGYLHKSKIIYRDLKPENILLDNNGYILLADFGLAKIKGDDEEPNSFCGTPEYLSPEMINGSGHDHTLDWWALGILIYEMLIGIPPFYNKNKHQMYFLIQHSSIRWPEQEKHGISVSEVAKDIITKLLEKERRLRLGFKEDVDEVLAHPFFKGLDFEKLLDKQIEAPFKPQVKSEKDLSNFDSKFLKLDVTESLLPQENIIKIEQKKNDFDKFGFDTQDP